MPALAPTQLRLLLIAFLASCQLALAQHGVIREYASLAPRPNATPLKPALDVPLTDVSVTLGNDRAYYMTGSSVSADAAAFSHTITIWRSTNMANWSIIRKISTADKAARSPEIHFLKNRYWLTLGLEGGGTELLAFTGTNLASSKFERAQITATGEDPSLFLDDDGVFYWVMGAGEVAKMKSDPLQGLAAAPQLVVQPVNGRVANQPMRSVAMHGAHLAKINGYYHLFIAERRLGHRDLGRTGLPGGTDDTFVSVSSRPDSGYSAKRYLAFPHAGQTTLFHDNAGSLWATFSNTDTRGIFRLKPGLFKVELVDATKAVWPIGFDFDKPDPPLKYSPQGVMLRPDTSHIYESATGFLKPVPMDPVPGQRAGFPWIRDTSIMRGADGNYYMTGTSGDVDSIHLWRSTDLKHFDYMKSAFQLDRTNKDLWYNQAAHPLLWAPEMHYLKGNYWLAWCMNQQLGMGLLKSSTGKPDGPYVPAYEGNRPLLKPNIDASLFVDDDGTPYFVWQGRFIRKMNPQMSGFAGDQMELLTVDNEQVGYEGIFLRKIGKWYVLLAAEWNGGGNRDDGTYDMMYSVSKTLAGPYSRRRVGVPHGGHSTLFQDGKGQWHLAFFGNDRTAPFRAMPGVAALEIRDSADDLLITTRQP